MYERIIEIIVYVITELKQKKNLNEVNIDELQNLGYSSSEISTALSWLVDRMDFNEKLYDVSSTSDEFSYRILHEAEKDIFTPEAWGEVMQLNYLGLITNDHIEGFIERAAMMGIRNIDTFQLKTYLAAILFNSQMVQLPGSRMMLSGNDTIN